MVCGTTAGAQPYSSTYLSTTTGIATDYFTGIFNLAAGSATYLTPTITLDGTGGGVTAASASFTATGPNTFSLRTSSGISTGGPIVLPDSTVFYSTGQFSGKASSGTNADMGVLKGVGASVTVSTSIIVTGTGTIMGQDAHGYSLSVASGINAGAGCVLVQGGNICGPVQGLPGTPGPPGAQGLAGQNGLLTFAGNIVRSYVLISTGMNSYDLLTQNTDGTLSIVSTTTATPIPRFLSNGSFTSWVTADSSDNVLRESQTSITLRISDMALYDSSLNVWDISIDTDGVFRTTAAGGF